jgi:hypothetical protein
MKRILFLFIALVVVMSATAWGQTTFTSTVTGGNWNAGATWVGGTAPSSATDIIIIADGATVTINATPITVASITVGQGISGILKFDGVAARAVTVSGDIFVATGASLAMQSSGTFTNTISLGGNLTNNGTFNMGSSSSTKNCTVTFTKNGDQTISGSGTVSFRTLVLSKTSVANKVIASTSVAFGTTNAMTFPNGTWEQSAGTLTTGTTQDISATGGILIDGTGSLIVPGSSAVSGSFTVNTSGTVTLGAGNNGLSTSGTGTISLTAGTINIGGKISVSSGTLTINGATVNIDPQTGSALAGSGNTFAISTSGNLTFTSGTVTIVYPNAATGAGEELKITTSGTVNISGSATFVLGNNLVPPSGTGDGFEINCSQANTLQNLTINSGSVACKTESANLTVKGTLTLTTGTLSIGAPIATGEGAWDVATNLILYNPITGTASNLLQSLNDTTSAPLSSIRIYGTASGINIPANIVSLNNLVLGNTAGTTLQNNLSIAGTLSDSVGTLNLNGFTLSYGSSSRLLKNS